MAWSPFAKKTTDRQAAPSPIETIESMRRRAKQRLIGSAALVLVGLIGFPWLFETQPRPVAIDIDISIPDKAKSKPLPVPAAPLANPEVAASASAAQVALPVAAAPVAKPAAAVAAAASLSGKEEIISSQSEEKSGNVTVKSSSNAIKSEVKSAETKPATAPPPAVAAKAVAAPTPAPAPTPTKPDDGARARALLDGKPAEKPAAKPVADTPAKATDAKERFIVQVGAFADAAKAREVRLKVERAGLTTYTHVAKTKDGERTRVRVGPLASRAEAEKVATKIKALDLPAAILTL